MLPASAGAGIALYGGTFNPIHKGHIHVARAVANQLGLAEIRMVLSARPPHRDPVPIADRWAMLRLACASEPTMVADDRELHRPAQSFTVDTLTNQRRRRPWSPLYWIIGMDSLLTLTSWYRWWRILQLAHLVVVPRPGYRDGMPYALRRLAQRRLWLPPATAMPGNSRVRNSRPRTVAGRIVLLEQPMLPISGTEIRTRVGAGCPPTGVVASVAQYIGDHSLYQNTDEPRGDAL